MGFEPTVPLSITGFQDQLLKPLGHLSVYFAFMLYLSSTKLIINLAGDAGLEPTHVAVKVLCLTDLANPLYKVVSAQGFEPRTHALEGRCSIQLSYAPTYIWSGKRDSNSRLQPWQGCALPLNYSRILK